MTPLFDSRPRRRRIESRNSYSRIGAAEVVIEWNRVIAERKSAVGNVYRISVRNVAGLEEDRIRGSTVSYLVGQVSPRLRLHPVEPNHQQAYQRETGSQQIPPLYAPRADRGCYQQR